MIISPPFLPTPDGDDDVTFVSRAMPDATDFAPGSGGAPLGSYPLTTALTWHNGLHVKAPLDAQQNPLPVRAIADGIVVFHCAPKKRNTAASDPQNYNAFDITAGWTDNGIVIIRHVTDIGASDADSTTVTYYSVYMHLSSIEKAAEAGSRIWRKDALGSAGRIMGHEHQIHFEICLSPSELQKLVGSGRSTTWTDPAMTPTADGRTDAVFGSVYVFLPQGTPTSATRPTNHLRRINPGPSAATDHFVPNTLGAAQWVEIRYQRGSGTIRSYRATDDVNKRWRVGDAIGQPLDEPEFEYSLYAEANRRHNSLDANAQASSSPSGWYELLRFARNLGPDRLPADAAHWRRIPAESGTVWADLNAPGTFKFSDADFPAFKGWQFFDDDTSHDNQRCDSVELKRLIRDPQQPETIREREVLARRLGNTQVRESLKRAICKFPTEWDRDTILQRYDWLKVDEEFRLDKGKEWDDFKAHCEAISFDQLPQEYKEAVWHFHPRAFISHMRPCRWFSRNELAKIYPDSIYTIVGKNSSQVRETFRLAINQCFRKYGLNTPYRMSHFFGQVAQESFYMMLTRESSISISAAIRTNHISIQPETNGYLRETPSNRKQIQYLLRYEGMKILANTEPGDGIKFRGRGFKQLTGRFNYSEYWVYRGWLKSSSYDAAWFKKNLPGPVIDDPQLAADVPFNAVDTAAYFFVSHGIPAVADSGATEIASRRVSSRVNAGEKPPAPLRWAETIKSFDVLGDA